MIGWVLTRQINENTATYTSTHTTSCTNTQTATQTATNKTRRHNSCTKNAQISC